MQPDLFSTRERASPADARHARQCRHHTALLAQSRHAMTRQHADRDARFHARQVTDAGLRRRLYEAIVDAALEPSRAEWTALLEEP